MLAKSEDRTHRQRTLAQLLRKVADGDWQSFSTLYAMTSPEIYGMVLHMTDRSPASEDLLQEIYVKIWKQAQRYNQSKAQVMTWLMAIARNRTLDWLRSEQSGMERLTTDHDPDDMNLAAASNPLTEIESMGLDSAISKCLHSLGDEQRHAIFLAYYNGLSQSELADRLASPLGTVKSWVRRGLESLRGCLQKLGNEV